MGRGVGRLHRLNLQHRMMLWFAGIILALLACLLVFLYLRIAPDMRAQAHDRLTSTRALFQNLQKLRGANLLSRCNNFANQKGLREALAFRPAASVVEVVEAAAAVLDAEVILVADARGAVVAAWSHSRAVDARACLQPALRRAREAKPGFVPETAGVDVSVRGIYETAWAPVPAPDGRRIVGTLAIGISIGQRLTSDLKRVLETDVTFFAGVPVPGREAARAVAVASTLDNERLARLIRGMGEQHYSPLNVPSEGIEKPFIVDLDGVDYLSATAPILGEKRQVIGAYVVQRPLHEVERFAEGLRVSLLLVAVIGVLAAVGASYLVANGVGRRVMNVVRAAEAISSGDWSERVPVEGPDDIRILAEAFNRMAARLQGWDADLRAEVALRTEELNQALARLDTHLRQMRQFHADASHELRTPLTIMRGEVEVALRTVRDTKEYQRVLNSILEEMNRVSSIVDHLLLLARADSGQIQVERQPVEINEILEDLHPQALLLAQPKRTAVTIREQGRVMVLGDSGKLRQLFLNLIDNAIKYTPEGGSVEVRLGSENGFAVVAVSDTGIGIADEDVPHIFDRFFRADRARNREIGGTGLGLAICQWVIEAHHGWIDVQTALGEGSTFTVYIPRVMPSAIHSGDEAEALAQPVH